jgi:DNA (cytosine-5)-methyltransferase 1
MYSKFVDGSYWEEHKIPHKNRPEITTRERENIIRFWEEKERGERWKTVRDATKGLPDPRTINKSTNKSTFFNHEFRAGARPYAGHSGSVLDEPSKTIKAGAHGVPGGENTLVLDDGSLRYYTVRESARIQTFPDKYFFCGSWTESMRQIGNAVPVKLANIIGESVANTLKRLENNVFKRDSSDCKAI